MRQCGIGLSLRSTDPGTPFRNCHVAADHGVGRPRAAGQRYAGEPAIRAKPETTTKKPWTGACPKEI